MDDTKKEKVSAIDKEKVQAIAFEVIIHASEAMDLCFKSLAAAKKGNYKESKECMDRYEEVISQAHKTQMELITDEAKGIEMPYSIIMVHAQDHLMQAIFIKRIINELIDVYKFQWEKQNEK